jgi:hypothetical protein
VPPPILASLLGIEGSDDLAIEARTAGGSHPRRTPER